MSETDSKTTRFPGGIKKSLASIFRSPAANAYDKVLADSVDQAEGDASSLNSDPKAGNISDKEKARNLVQQRNASSPSGHFVLGPYKPAAAAQGYAGYYTAKAAIGK
jgi:hypothetical protein